MLFIVGFRCKEFIINFDTTFALPSGAQEEQLGYATSPIKSCIVQFTRHCIYIKLKSIPNLGSHTCQLRRLYNANSLAKQFLTLCMAFGTFNSTKESSSTFKFLSIHSNASSIGYVHFIRIVIFTFSMQACKVTI